MHDGICYELVMEQWPIIQITCRVNTADDEKYLKFFLVFVNENKKIKDKNTNAWWYAVKFIVKLCCKNGDAIIR